MKSGNAAFLAILSLCAQLLFPPSGAAGFIPTTESTAREEIVRFCRRCPRTGSRNFLPGDIRGQNIGRIARLR